MAGRDDVQIVTIIKRGDLRRYLRDPFFSNSLFLMLASAITAIMGLVFWILAGNHYSKDEVGIVTVLISTSALIAYVSKIGLDQSLTRYIPEGNRSNLFSTFIIITAGLATIISLFVVTLGMVWPDSGILAQNLEFLLILTILTTISNDICTTFTALRNSKFTLLHYLLQGSRLALIVPLSYLGTSGLLSAIIGGYVVSTIFSSFFLMKQGIRLTKIDLSFFRRSIGFSLGNHISGLLQVAPNHIVPMLLFATLGAAASADFYIVFSIITILFIIPGACNTSLFVEGSHGEPLTVGIKKTILTTAILLSIAVIAVFLLGDFLLRLVGEDYVIGGSNLLQSMALSSFPVAIVGTCMAILKTKNRLRPLIFLSGINCFLVLFLSYALTLAIGLEGVGYAWISSNVISSIIGIWIIKLLIKPQS